MKTIKVKIKGVCPLLQHRFPIEEHGENKKVSKKKIYIPEEEAEKACYRGKDGMLYQPSEHIYQAMVQASTDFKFEGRKTYKEVVKAGIVVEPEFIPHNKNTWDEIDARRVNVQRSAVVRWRPRLNEWELEFDIQIIDDENITPSILKDILDRAGQLKGIGDYRPRFGRFQVVSWEEA